MADQGVRVLSLRPSWEVISPRSARGLSVRLAVLVMVAAILLSASSAQAALDLKRYYRKSVAVVIGIENYPKWRPRLQWAVRDARRVADVLKKDWGFDEVHMLLDEQATRARIISFLQYELPPKLGKGDRVFLFYSGHGHTEKVGNVEHGYIVPYDADQRRPAVGSIKMRDLREWLNALPAKHVFAALDACFSGSLLERGSGPPREKDPAYIETMGQTPVRQAVTAGTRGQKTFEAEGWGFFTRQLLRGLQGWEADLNRDRVITGRELGHYLVTRVPGRAKRDYQRKLTPVFGALSGGGDFLFIPPGRQGGDVAEPTRRPRVTYVRQYGSIELTPNVSGAEIYLSGEPLGEETRQGHLMRIDRVPVGAVRLRLGKKGYKDWIREVRVRVGKTTRVDADLVAVGPPSAPHRIGAGLDAMVYVPAGWFIMGSNSWAKDEKPRRRVYLDKFFIDKYPVTNVRFRSFEKPKTDYGSKFNGAGQPVVGVTWYQARDYCGSVGKRLPTEAEWEKTARGVDGRRYPWGNDWDPSKVIWSNNSGGKTHPVDRTYNTHRSPYGAVDMSGNVWQWVGDWFKADYYWTAPDRNPKGPASSSRRVFRGGSWNFINPTDFRAALRGRPPPGYWGNDLGFRCAKAP